MNVLGRNVREKTVAATPFDRAHLPRGEFAFKETISHYVLHDLLYQRVQKFEKPAQERMQEDAPQEDEREFDNYGARGDAQPYPGRPPAYQNWDIYQRMTWDNTQHHWEEQRLRDRQAEERRVSFEEGVDERLTQMEDNISRIRQDVEVMGYYQQRYHHDMFDWTEQQRHWYDFNNRKEYQQHVERQDFSTMRWPDGSGPSHSLPHHPEMNHPQWWPGEYRSHGGGADPTSQHHSEVQDPFDTRDLSRSLYDSFFGPNH